MNYSTLSAEDAVARIKSGGQGLFAHSSSNTAAID